ncbi:MAG: restriction endonuclease subunit S [Candidatus Solibacter sp.]|nr:restriction endonuclease subunit S [Candidatus Solibacter sp.]
MDTRRQQWTSRKIGDLCRLVNGRAFKPSQWSDQGLPIIRIQNLNDPEKPFNYFSGAYESKHLVKPGDVLLSWSGTPGTSFGCFIWDRDAGVLNQHIFRVHVNEGLCTPLFFVYGVNNALDEMIGKAHGGVGLRHITKGKLEQIELPIAPLPEQHRIEAKVRECFGKLDEITELATFRRKNEGLSPVIS